MLANSLDAGANTKGAIVNIASVAAVRGAAAGAAYSASKAGLLSLARNTAWMYRHDGIRCNSVLPGGVITNIKGNSGSTFDETKPGSLTPYHMCSPGVSTTEDIAGAVLYPITATSANGAELALDKGWTAA